MLWVKWRLGVRLLVIAALGALTAGCFQPMYAESTITGAPGLRDKLSGVELGTVRTGPNDARLGVNVKNALMFNMYGSATGSSPTHRLEVRLATSRTSIIVDIRTARPDNEDYGIDAAYTLKEIATDKVVVTGNTFARVTYDIPGQEQRFARARGLRDAEDRATQEIANKISQRLASYFVAGT